MVTRRRFLTLVGGTGLTLAASSAGIACGSDAPPENPTVRFGQESCSRCGMVIDDRRFAAAWITPGNKERHFDDMACLLREMHSAGPEAGTRYFASDYEREVWLDAAVATYVVSEEIRSPMASGIAAVSSANAGHRLATALQGHGHVPTHSWSALATAVDLDAPAPMDGHGS